MGAALVSVLDILFPVFLLFRPSAGVAMAVLFILGPRAWPSAALGALFGGLYLGYGWDRIGVDVAVDTCQALLAWILVRRYLSLPAPLFKTGHLLGFHLLIGPVATGVGAVLRVTGYLICSVPLPYSPELTLLYGWVGQSFGAVIATTTGMCLLHPAYPWNRRRTSVALPVLVLLVMTFYARWLVEVRVEALESLTLSRQADQLAKELRHELSASAGTLRATASFLGASEAVSSAELERFVRTLAQGRAEPLALAWFARVPGKENIVYPELEVADSFVSYLLQTRSVSSVLSRDGSRSDSEVESPTGEAVRGDWGEFPLYILAEPTRDAEGNLSGVIAGAFDLRLVAQRALSNTVETPGAVLALGLETEAGLPPLAISAQLPDTEGSKVSERYEMGGLAWSIQAYPVWTSPQTPRMGLSLGLLMTASLMLFFLRLSNQTIRIELLKHDIEYRAEALRDLNSELESAVEAAREADQAKSLFLANISHEIRTPLNGILGLTRLVLESPLRPAQNEQLRHVELSAQNLLALFNNILDLSRMERGQIETDLQLQNLSVLLQETARMLGLQAEAKNVELILAGDAEIPYLLAVDGLKLRQVLLNLLGNAVKFTPSGGEVELSVALLGRTEKAMTVKFSVRDSGVGIAEDQLEKIFQPFVQADAAKPADGSGLGLAISRTLVEQMGGRLEVQSREGEGSTFTFTLECGAGPSLPFAFLTLEVAAIPTRVCLLHPRRRAVVEDNLAQWGFPTTKESAAARLLVLDESSLTCTLQEGQAAIAVLPVTNLASLLENCLQLGAVPLVRPFSSRSLGQAVWQALTPAALPADGSKNKAYFPSYSGRRALVVDDNLTNRLLATLLFQRMGFVADSLEDGESALTATLDQTYDVVLLDIRLPGLDGYEVAARLRERGLRVPIIAATAHAQGEHGERVRAAGMDAFLTKPLDEHRLREVVLQLVPPSGGEEFEAGVLLHSVGGDRDSACDVIRGFLQEEAQLRTALHQARTSDELALACHTLKGAVEVFGMATLRERLRRLERDAERGKIREIGSLGEAIDNELASLVRALTSFLKESSNDG